jgi:hypothetical protein
MRKFNMQNVFVWILPPKKGGYKWRYTKDHERVFNYLRLQIHNSLDLGWDPEDIVPITNFPFEHMGVKAHELEMDVCNWSSFANRMIAVNEMIQKGVINDNFWVHDLDAYQLEPFDFPESCRGVSFTRHAPRRTKPQGASVFYRKNSFDVVEAMAKTIRIFKVSKEESFFPYLLRKGGVKAANRKRVRANTLSKAVDEFVVKNAKDKEKLAKLKARHERSVLLADTAEEYFGKFADRFEWIGWEYNLCHRRMFDKKYKKAEKPIKVAHCKLEYKNVVDCFYGGINGHNKQVITDRVGELFFLYNLLDESQRRNK